jgi:hypothetical protein
MAIHEGNANRRLASESINILFLPVEEVPEGFKKEFIKLKGLIEETVKAGTGPTPYKIKGIQNKTAAKYLKLLYNIYGDIRQ